MILDVKGLKKTFKGKYGGTVAVDDVSFMIKEGECLGIVGESGSGKSTVANLIAGLIPADSGSVNFCGNEVCGKKGKAARKARKKMQMVFQNPNASFNPKIKLIKAIAEPLKYDDEFRKSNHDELVYEALENVGLKKEYAQKYAWEISGGECQRAAIARAIISKPKLILCDEVTSALDVSIQAQILKLIYELKSKLKTSYMFISHDLASVSSVCDKVAVMYKGSILEFGKTGEVVKDPKHPYTADLIDSALNPGKRALQSQNDDVETSACKYYSQCRKTSEECLNYDLPGFVNEESYSACIKYLRSHDQLQKTYINSAR